MTEIYQSQEFSIEYENLKRRKAEGQGEADLTLWNDNVDDFAEGDVLKLTDC